MPDQGVTILSPKPNDIVNAALPVIGRTFYEVASYYPYTIIPLFVLMGGFAEGAGITKELYQTFDKWFRKLPGGLGIETIDACAGFAALSGSSVAGAAAMGTVALFLPGMMGC